MEPIQFDDPYWSYLMVLAWVATRDRSIVTLAGDHSRDPETYRKDINTQTGHSFSILNATVYRNEAWLERRVGIGQQAEGRLDEPHSTVQDVSGRILRALQDGALKANAVRDTPGEPEIIPMEAWAHLRLRPAANLDHEAVLEEGRGSKWIRPRFLSETVFGIWPADKDHDRISMGLVLEPPAKKGLGRPKGSGSYMKFDEPLLKEMAELLRLGRAASVYEAAGMVADRARGNGTWLSRRRRLTRRFKKHKVSE